jgi:hypothetical protein
VERAWELEVAIPVRLKLIAAYPKIVPDRSADRRSSRYLTSGHEHVDAGLRRP